MKRFGLTFLGFFLFVASIAVAFLYVNGARDGGNPFWYLILSVILLGVAVFVLYSAGRLDGKNFKFDDMTGVSGAQRPASILEKNSKLVSEWNETNDQRDKLKMLEAAGAAEEK